MLRILLTLLKIGALAALTVLIVVGSARLFGAVTDAARPDGVGTIIQITVAEDEDEGQLAQRLSDAGLINSPMIFQGQLRLGGGALEAGTYPLRKGMSAEQIIGRITGDAPPEEPAAAQAPEATDSFPITIPEGWRIEEIAEEYERLGGEGGFDAFMQAVNEVDRSQYDFLASVPPELPIEGYLFPDTYTFSATNPAQNVGVMLDNFDNKFDQEMRSRSEQMGLTIHQVVTFASLVEKEAQVADERPIIADVYLDRYSKGWKLDADPTVQYILGQKGDWWPKLSGDDLFVDNPFNMYQYAGMPPGPIANPGSASLQAVLEPEPTEYMYFVAKGDGSNEHYFAASKEEQDANVKLYEQNLKQAGQ